MTSSLLADVLRDLQPFVFAGTAAAAIVQWRRRPGRASAWLAVCFGVLALVVLTGRLLPEGSEHTVVIWVRKAMIGILVLFPYFLYRFMISLVPAVPWFKILAGILTASVALCALVLPPFPEDDAVRPGWLQLYIGLLLIQWVLLTGRVVQRLWHAGHGQPAVARRRMRTMSFGAGGLALALVVAGEFPSQTPIVTIIVQLLTLTAPVLMLVGFAPPYILRASWRRHEESALKESEQSLVRTTTASEVAETLLPHARASLGAVAVVLLDPEGKVVATNGLEEEEAQRAIESQDSETSSADRTSSVVKIPMQSGSLIAITSPLTPFFGTEEIASLEGFAALADLALTRNELLESQRRLAAIVESSQDAIIAKSLDGVILEWNRGAERIYGYIAEEAMGQHISMLVPTDRPDEVSEILEKVQSGKSIEHYETKRRTKDGGIIDVSLTVSPMTDASGSITGASTIARDVTARRQLEQERETAREEADRANQAKNEFLSRMSHELRTPLNAVLGFAQLLDLDSLSDEQRDWTNEILKAGQHLLDLINEVLDISRIEAGNLRLSLEPVDALAVSEECISLLTPLASEEAIRVVLESGAISESKIHVLADRQRLKQVLLNIISNGIKYNRREGTVRVSFELIDDVRLKIHVTDTGQGIPQASLERLFAPFDRLGAEASRIEGTGLGLALSKALVEAMKGTISVSSEEGRGTTFSVELAVVEPATSRAEPPAKDEAQTGVLAKTILYIEDNLSNLKVVERFITRRPGIQVIPAMQGGLGVTLARDHQPDLILLDLNLPDMSGEEVIGRLQADPATTALPIVVISADATMGQVQRLIGAGARAYLSKPLELERFIEVIDLFCS